MHKKHIVITLLTTAILCAAFASCSSDKNKNNDDSFTFDNAGIVEQKTTKRPNQIEDKTKATTVEETSSGEENPSTSAVSTAPQQTTTKPNTTMPEETTTLPKPPASTTAPTTPLVPVETTKAPSTPPKPTTTQESSSQEQTTQPVITTQSATETPTLEPPTSEEDTALESEVLRLINAERKKNGLPALAYSAELSQTANIRARELSVHFSHTRPDGSQWNTVSPLVFAENIGTGQNSPGTVVGAWMASSGHKANILNPDYTTAAVGYYYSGNANGYFWVLHLGK